MTLQHAQWMILQPLLADGCLQMALDDALVEWLQQPQTPPNLIIVRTYCWQHPTLSVGVHQHGRHLLDIADTYRSVPNCHIVRRPTGGRAILHGQDISFAFASNHPQILKMSLSDSYCLFSTWVRRTLEQCGMVLQNACTQDERAYTQSGLCFNTQTPSDLLSHMGQKIVGSAQLRRKGALLQHGAAFLQPFEIAWETFNTALHQVIQNDLGPAQWQGHVQEQSNLWTLCQARKQYYALESESILAKLSTTSGSHLDPASD